MSNTPETPEPSTGLDLNTLNAAQTPPKTTPEPSTGLDLNTLFESARRMGEQIVQAQQEAAAAVHTGQAGGGAVRITVTGDLHFHEVVIDPAVVAEGDTEMIQDLVLAALRDVTTRINQQATPPGLENLDLGSLLGESTP